MTLDTTPHIGNQFGAAGSAAPEQGADKAAPETLAGQAAGEEVIDADSNSDEITVGGQGPGPAQDPAEQAARDQMLASGLDSMPPDPEEEEAAAEAAAGERRRNRDAAEQGQRQEQENARTKKLKHLYRYGIFERTATGTDGAEHSYFVMKGQGKRPSPLAPKSITEKQLKAMLLAAILDKGWTQEIAIYRGRRIDSALTQQATILLMTDPMLKAALKQVTGSENPPNMPRVLEEKNIPPFLSAAAHQRAFRAQDRMFYHSKRKGMKEDMRIARRLGDEERRHDLKEARWELFKEKSPLARLGRAIGLGSVFNLNVTPPAQQPQRAAASATNGSSGPASASPGEATQTAAADGTAAPAAPGEGEKPTAATVAAAAVPPSPPMG